MEAVQLLKTRRSVRKFTGQKIPEDVLKAVLEDTMMAPSWKNTQTAGYVVARSEEMKQKLLAALPPFNARSAELADVIVVMTTRHGRSGFERDGTYSTVLEDRWEYFDAGIACQTFCLAAWARGLSTCIMGLYDDAAVREILQLPEEYRITAVIPTGYGAETPAAPKRKPLDEKVTYI